MTFKQFLFWLPMIILAFANAMMRELVFIHSMSELKAHQLSTITLLIFCSVYVWFIIPLLRIQNSKQALLIGFAWMLLTIVFEFSLGLLTHKSWAYLLQDYDIVAGHIWPVFLIWLLLLPWLCYTMQFSKSK